MTEAEVKQVYKELKEEGYTTENLLKGLIAMYKDHAITKTELKRLCELLGVEFKEEFLK